MNTYKLEHPITYGSEEIRELKVNRPTAKVFRKYQIAKLGELNTGEWIDILSKLTSEEPTKLDRLDFKDLTKLIEIVGRC